ncbi:MAG: DUF3604 domain-containing protein [Actinophytocola sp.]|nr:DUF3604 domain-containing protein [Actinophytocola sp.]
MTHMAGTKPAALTAIAGLLLTGLQMVTSAPVIAASPAPGAARVQPAPAGEWVAGDLHVHTTYSHDSYGGPDDDNTEVDQAYTAGHSVEQAFRLADERDLDFLTISDHNDVRSQTDKGFGRFGVIGVRAYENSLRGHAQMLGADHIHDNGDSAASDVRRIASKLRADGGVFGVNHPAEASGFPHELDWSYGYQVVPDVVEAWNVMTLWQPPLPAANNNDDNVRYWEGWLDRGKRVAAVGGSDSHWASTSAVQGPGQPTTWVYVTDHSEAGILEGLRQGRTSIAAQPPALSGVRVFLEADGDQDGVWESMVGDTVPAGSALRVRVEGGAGTLVRLVATGGRQAGEAVPVTGERFTHDFAVNDDATWVRAEVFREDAADVRQLCDPLVGDRTSYCRNRIAREAMTSAIYLGNTVPPP